MRFNIQMGYWLAILILLIQTPVLADDYNAEDDFFGDSPIVLTVTRMSKPLQASPVSVTVIDRQMIRDSGARQVADIFRMVPGFIVGYHTGSTPGVTYQGLGSTWQHNMQVLIDGRSVFIPTFGGIPWSSLPLLVEDIERIEITRGPNAVTYGSNAFLTTINIITRQAAEDYGYRVSLTGSLDNTTGVRDFYLRSGNQQGDLDWRLTAGHIEDSGFSNANDTKNTDIINLRTDFLTADNQFWTIQLGVNSSTFGTGTDNIADNYRDENVTNSYQNIKWEWISDKVSTTALLTHTRNNARDSYTTGRLNGVLDDKLTRFYQAFGVTAPVLDRYPDDITLDVNLNRLSDRTDAELYQNRELSPSMTWVYGASLRRDDIQSGFLFHDQAHRRLDVQRLFTSLEWKYSPQLLFDAGLMQEDSEMIEHRLAARLSVIRKLDDHNNLRLVVSSANRSPVLAETEGDFSYRIPLPAALLAANPGLPLPPEIPVVDRKGNPNLQPENIVSSEIGLFSEYLAHQLTTDVRLFNYHISDQITEIDQNGTDSTTGIPVTYSLPQNNTHSDVNGLEVSFNYSPRHKNFRLYGGFSRVQASNPDKDLERSFPSIDGFIGGHYNFSRRQQLSVEFYHTGAMSWRDTVSQLQPVDKLDLRYRITLDPKHDTRLELIGYNLYKQQAEYINRNIQERTLLLRISSRF